jgi:HEAT repeat protein
LRENVVFWLGQRNDPETSAYLRAYFTRTTEPSIRERILFSLAQLRSEENAAWLIEVALDESQTTDIRKSAIFWAGQQRSFPIARLQTLYGQMRDREVREQIIFALSQRRDDAAVDALIAIARQEQDRELRRAAIFWLGQSNNPRAAEFLLELINQ